MSVQGIPNLSVGSICILSLYIWKVYNTISMVWQLSKNRLESLDKFCYDMVERVNCVWKRRIMRDKIMKALGLFTALSLAVCLVASGLVSNTRSSDAATSSLKWTRITIPVEVGKQLYPGSDVGPMAVSPNGATVFAAVQDESSLAWSLLKSIDGALAGRIPVSAMLSQL